MGLLGACRGGEVAPSPTATPSPALRSDISVTEISLGSSIGPDRRVSQPRQVFSPSDTVYASVVTKGSGSRGQLKARWTDQGSKVVAESALDISAEGTTVSEFHISKPNGLAAGGYEVEIFLDGASTGKRSFSVQ